MKKSFIILTSVCLLAVLRVGAQQEIMMSQYMFNGLVLNPAYAGTHPYWSATALHRSQWVQFDKAPVTQTIALDGPIGVNREVGLGITLSNDALGLISQQEIGFNGSYKIQAGPGTLSFGLRGTFGIYSANVTEAVIWDEEDPLYQANISGKMVPKIGTGAYYYTSNWFAGFSVPVLYAADNGILAESSLAERYFTNHFYLNGGMVFTPSPSIAVKPVV
ncbi:MAG: PorP/SprF family type IX secretion system membrane protein, partial [Flavobacteriales bacterium]|nr:PorP/SprF family type IX secretion system membrane protein [Flavobacteriales bacterium]